MSTSETSRSASTMDAGAAAVAVADARLAQALRALPADVPTARIEALSERVLEQWQSAVQRAPAGEVVHVGRPWLALRGRGSRAGWMAGAAGLTACAVFALQAWLHPADPTLDDLLQPDVLSQMTAGEM